MEAGEKKLTAQQSETLLAVLQKRFETNQHRHEGLNWPVVKEKLESNAEKLWSINEMEQTGGEPDVVGEDEQTGAYLLFDCVPESPAGRRSLCLDPAALEARKENKPKHSAVGMAADMGIEILTEQQYRKLQTLGEFDKKTSSWIATPEEIRKLGGALFCDRRYNHVFTYHNGAESYYAARGFRGVLRV